MEQVLLLNQSYEPILTIGWKKAISMFFLGKVEVVKEYEREIHSKHLTIKIPAVVRLLNSFKRYKKKVRFNRMNVIARDNRKCQYCGKSFFPGELTLDHVIPRAKGGKTSWKNIVSCCSSCNVKKADRTPEEAGMRLIKQPITPDWLPIFSITLSWRQIPEIWKDFCYLKKN